MQIDWQTLAAIFSIIIGLLYMLVEWDKIKFRLVQGRLYVTVTIGICVGVVLGTTIFGRWVEISRLAREGGVFNWGEMLVGAISIAFISGIICLLLYGNSKTASGSFFDLILGISIAFNPILSLLWILLIDAIVFLTQMLGISNGNEIMDIVGWGFLGIVPGLFYSEYKSSK